MSQYNSYEVSGVDEGTIIVHSTKTGIVEYRADNVFANFVLGLCCLPNGSVVAYGEVADGDNASLEVPLSWSRPWWDTLVLLGASPSLHQAPTLLPVEEIGR